MLKTNTILREHGGDAVSKAVGYATNTDPTAQQHLNDIARQFGNLPTNKVKSYVAWVGNVSYNGTSGVILLILGVVGITLVYKYPEKFIIQPKTDLKTNIPTNNEFKLDYSSLRDINSNRPIKFNVKHIR